jgi:hypothetical protein
MNHITRSPALDGNSLRTLRQIFAPNAARFIRYVRPGRVQALHAETAFVAAGREILL